MKLLNNFHEKLLIADDTTASLKPYRELEFTKASEMNSHPDEKSRELQTEERDYISAIFSSSQRPKLYKFKSEDSGVELASGANSPSIPSTSEQSFVVHSRESSCDSCNPKSDCTSIPYSQNSETRQTVDLVDTSVAATTQDLHPEEHSSSTITADMQGGKDMDNDQMKSLGIRPEGSKRNVSEKLRDNTAETGRSCLKHTHCGKECAERTSNQFEQEPLTTDSLEEYMDHCCRLSEVR